MATNPQKMTDSGRTADQDLARFIGSRQEAHVQNILAKARRLAYADWLDTSATIAFELDYSHSPLMSFVNREDRVRNSCLSSYYNLRTLSQETWHGFPKFSPQNPEPSKFKLSLQLPCVILRAGEDGYLSTLTQATKLLRKTK